MYDVIDISKYIVLYCKSHNFSINNLKLQKLLYFVQAQFLVTYNCAAFDEDIEAWDFGPVIPEAYNYFKIFGCMEIPSLIIGDIEDLIDKEHCDAMDEILELCSPLTSTYLTSVTYRQDPWKNNYNPLFNKKIPQEDIQKFFSD